ncbi:MAG: hypothetical protein K6T35_10320 [Meiothermus silvanus]|nr:hypothetical protein [Allomeiothermus silvanus]
MYHSSLSWEAIGVFCWAQTQPTFTLKNLLRSGTGRDRAYRILRELLTLGYLERFERRDESGKFLEYGYRVSRPNPEGPEAGPTPKATPLGENPEAAPLPENPLRANPEAAECVSCTEQSTQGRFPLTADPHTAPEEPSKAAESASRTEIEPLREKAQTDEQPLLFKRLKEEILNELLSALNKQLKEELLTELLSAVNSSLSKKKPAAKPEAPAKSGKPDAVAELAASLGLSDWQRNFARSAVKEEASRTAWFGLARNHPEVLKASYRLLDKTGQRTPVAWVAWLTHLAEDVKRRGADAVQQCMEKAITSASPAGAWGYYRACLEGSRDEYRHSRAAAGPSASAYERLAPEYRIVKRIPGKETVYAQ